MNQEDPRPPGWAPPFSLEERLKHVLVPPSLYMTYKAAKERRRGEREIRLVPFLCAPGSISIDAGANVGTWTWVLARHSREVHAFEPNPKDISKLQRNVGNLGNATIHGIALSDRNGEAVLHIPRGAKGHSNQRATLSAVTIGDDRRYSTLLVE